MVLRTTNDIILIMLIINCIIYSVSSNNNAVKSFDSKPLIQSTSLFLMLLIMIYFEDNNDNDDNGDNQDDNDADNDDDDNDDDDDDDVDNLKSSRRVRDDISCMFQ